MSKTLHSRRTFLTRCGCAAWALTSLQGQAAESEAVDPTAPPGASEPIIDIHQHLNYAGRTNEQFLAHQRAMGITTSILLPAGTPMQTRSTHDGSSDGLAALISGSLDAAEFAQRHPGFLWFANEVTDHPEARQLIEKLLQLGACGIGEQKFGVDCDSAAFAEICALAREYCVPILIHFQHGTYNHGFERFWRVLERFPTVNFVGHAQTWWGYIDEYHQPAILYPTTPVVSGGLTHRYLSDYPNLFGDLSAGSGLNAMLRDEDHTRWFWSEHQDRLLFGSDCNDPLGRGPGCQGSQTIATIRRLAPNKTIERKLLYQNARNLLGL